MELSFLIKATGIVFRESFEAVLIYGIIVSYFKRQGSESQGLKSAQWGLALGILASLFFGVALAGALPSFSPEVFSYLEIFFIFGGSLLMLYMVFWMSEHTRHLKSDIESGVQQKSSYAIIGTIFIAVFREGIEAVVYLYSLIFEQPTLTQGSSVLLSLTLGVSLAFVIYRLIVQGSKLLSLKMVFRISGAWLLLSSSSLLATGIDKLFSAGFLESVSQPIFNLTVFHLSSRLASFFESFVGLRLQSSWPHLGLFLLYWIFVVYKDPLRLRS